MFTLKSTVERREAKEARLQAIESRLEQLSVKESSQEIDNTNFVKVEERVSSFEEKYRKSNEDINIHVSAVDAKLTDLSGAVSAVDAKLTDLSGAVSAIMRDDSLMKRIEALEQRDTSNTDQNRIHELETQIKELREQNHALETRLNELSRRSFALGSSPVTPIGFTFGSGLARTSTKFTQKSVEPKEKEEE